MLICALAFLMVATEAGFEPGIWRVTSCTLERTSTKVTLNGSSYMGIRFAENANDGCGSFHIGDEYKRVQLPFLWGAQEVMCPTYLYNTPTKLALTFNTPSNKAIFDWYCGSIIRESIGPLK
jgi:hypothetical protein